MELTRAGRADWDATIERSKDTVSDIRGPASNTNTDPTIYPDLFEPVTP